MEARLATHSDGQHLDAAERRVLAPRLLGGVAVLDVDAGQQRGDQVRSIVSSAHDPSLNRLSLLDPALLVHVRQKNGALRFWQLCPNCCERPRSRLERIVKLVVVAAELQHHVPVASSIVTGR